MRRKVKPQVQSKAQVQSQASQASPKLLSSQVVEHQLEGVGLVNLRSSSSHRKKPVEPRMQINNKKEEDEEQEEDSVPMNVENNRDTSLSHMKTYSPLKTIHQRTTSPTSLVNTQNPLLLSTTTSAAATTTTTTTTTTTRKRNIQEEDANREEKLLKKAKHYKENEKHHKNSFSNSSKENEVSFFISKEEQQEEEEEEEEQQFSETESDPETQESILLKSSSSSRSTLGTSHMKDNNHNTHTYLTHNNTNNNNNNNNNHNDDSGSASKNTNATISNSNSSGYIRHSMFHAHDPMSLIQYHTFQKCVEKLGAKEAFQKGGDCIPGIKEEKFKLYDKLTKSFFQAAKNRKSVFYDKHMEDHLIMAFIKEQSEDRLVIQLEFDVQLKLFKNEGLRQIIDDYWVSNRAIHEEDEWKFYLCWMDLMEPPIDTSTTTTTTTTTTNDKRTEEDSEEPIDLVIGDESEAYEEKEKQEQVVIVLDDEEEEEEVVEGEALVSSSSSATKVKKLKLVYELICIKEGVQGKKHERFIRLCSLYHQPIEALSRELSKEKIRCSQCFKNGHQKRSFILEMPLFDKSLLAKIQQDESNELCIEQTFNPSSSIPLDTKVTILMQVEMDKSFLYRVRAKAYVVSDSEPLMNQQLAFRPLYMRTQKVMHYEHSQAFARAIFWHLYQSKTTSLSQLLVLIQKTRTKKKKIIKKRNDHAKE